MTAGEDFKSVQEAISSTLVSTTRSATRISAEDLDFHRSFDPSLATSLDAQNVRLLRLSERLLGNAVSGTGPQAPKLEDVEDVENNWRAVVDVIDALLEKADTCLDEYRGVVRRLSPAQQEQAITPKTRQPRVARDLRDQDIPKPQLVFENVPTNNDTAPFKPLLTRKPHAIVPLSNCLRKHGTKNGSQQYEHPYQTEIEQSRYPSYIYNEADPIPPTPYDSSTATWVDTPETAADMLRELREAKEIAIDLEHHDTRSYTGIVSLMQISTRNKDWIVDTLKPWRRKLEMLNEVFADPKILKVLHGAHMDAVWLQRDLGLYLVGLFDTHLASRVLGYPGGSLAFLLKKFVDFDAQKQYQTADWRIRPLPPEMLEYARSDTHFLLYIYDNMRNELIAKSHTNPYNEDCIQMVLDRSKLVALQRFEHPIYDEIRGQGAGWYKLLARTPALFSKQQFAVLRAVHQWRDKVAREQDDSVLYVMANHIIFNVARAMPEDMASLLGLCHPISQSVRLRASELLGVVSKAKAAGADGPDMIEIIKEFEGAKVAPIQGYPIPTTGDTKPPDVQRTVSTSSMLPVRTESSHFWGPMFGSSVWQPSERATGLAEGIQLALPLPQLTAETFRDPAETASMPQSLPRSINTAMPAEHEYIKERTAADEKSDGVFVVKQLGGSRKRKIDDVQPSITHNPSQALVEDGLMPLDDRLQKTLARKLRKAEKKAAKEQRKFAEARANYTNGIEATPATTANGNSAPPEPIPFNYASAPSILHAPRERESKRAKTGKDRPFNPYTKAMDAPKGMPRAQKERAGKSATFRD